MIKLILAVAITAASFSTSAVESKEKACTEISSFAGNIMTLRQLNKPMTEVFKLAKGSKFVESVIIQAYEAPVFSQKSNKDRMVSDFKDKWFLTCIKM